MTCINWEIIAEKRSYIFTAEVLAVVDGISASAPYCFRLPLLQKKYNLKTLQYNEYTQIRILPFNTEKDDGYTIKNIFK